MKVKNVVFICRKLKQIDPKLPDLKYEIKEKRKFIFIFKQHKTNVFTFMNIWWITSGFVF